MSRIGRISTGVLVFVLGGLWPSGTALTAQQGQDSDVVGDTVELMFEREVFNYPTYQRRNPFQPLTGADQVGPRFEDLVLLGVVVATNPDNSLALLGARQAGSTQQDVSRTYRLRSGEILGNNRILEIRRDQVLVEVEEFGLRQTRTLTIRRMAPQPAVPLGGSAPPDEPNGEADDPSADSDSSLDVSQLDGSLVEDRIRGWPVGRQRVDHGRHGNGGWS